MPLAEARILIVRLGAFGDIVMASALLQAIRNATPRARVTWVCGARVQDLVSLLDVDEVIAIDDRALFSGGPLGRARALGHALWSLAGRHFDLAVLAHMDARYRVLLWSVRSRRTRIWSRVPTFHTNPIPGRAYSDEYARLLDRDSISRGPIEGHFPLADVRSRLPRAAEEFGSSCVALVPGGSRNLLSENSHRRWPVERYAELARALIAQGRRVILVGDDGDAWVRPSFEGIGVDDRIGRYALIETLALFASAGVVVSHDTGPLHLARLVRARLVALFGPTMPREFVNEGERTVVLWGGERLACRPCYNGRYFAQCDNHLCMKDISVPQVIAAVAQLAG